AAVAGAGERGPLRTRRAQCLASARRGPGHPCHRWHRADAGQGRRAAPDPRRRHGPDAARRMALARRCARPIHDPPHGLRGRGRRPGDRVGPARHRRGIPRRAGTAAMTAWAAEDLARYGDAEEIDIASVRADGSLRSYVTIWIVGVGDALYVRSAFGSENPW